MKKLLKTHSMRIVSWILTLTMCFSIGMQPIYAKNSVDDSSHEESAVIDEEQKTTSGLSEETDYQSENVRNVEILVTNYDVPISGATVKFDESTAVTDESGVALFENIAVSESEYPVTVIAKGYGKIECSVKVQENSENSTLKINLFF